MFSLLKPVLRCYSTKILKYILDYKRRRRKRKKEKQMKEGGDNKQEGGGEGISKQAPERRKEQLAPERL